jgi:hypothetical protein
MEAGGRDKILPSPSLRKALNPIQERVMKDTRFRKPTQWPVDWLPRTSSHSRVKERINKEIVDDWQTIKGKLKN